jgi:Tfp pilus assembly protein PilX
MDIPFTGRPPLRSRAVSYSCRHNGLASVLAMMFLVLFSTLAVGFYEATGINAQIARNERMMQLADIAADSGMKFMRYQLGSTPLPAGPASGLMDSLAAQLGPVLNGTANMGGYTVQNTGGTIWLPAANNWITLDPTTGARFRAKITNTGTTLNVIVTGSGNSTTIEKAIELQYQPSTTADIFTYGIASKSPITLGGNASVTGVPAGDGSVLCAASGLTGLTMSGSNASISGDYSYVNPALVNSYGGGTIDTYASTSSNFAQHVHSGAAAPNFPYVDPSVYAQYATNPYVAGSSTLVNVTLPPGTYSLSNVTIQGVLYLQSPCKLSIAGQSTIQGVIVSDCSSTVGTLSTNVITISGQVQVSGMSTLPNTFPAGELALNNAFILAPYDSLNVSGNFGTVSGCIIAGQITMAGNASGTIEGSVINEGNTLLSITGNGGVSVVGNGPSNVPQGVNCGGDYVPVQGSYIEVPAQ